MIPVRAAAARNTRSAAGAEPILQCTQPAYQQRTDLRNAVKVAVNVHYPHPVVEGCFGDEQVGNRGSVPHSMMMGEVVLKPERPVEKVSRRRNDLEGSL